MSILRNFTIFNSLQMRKVYFLSFFFLQFTIFIYTTVSEMLEDRNFKYFTASSIF